MKHSKNHSTTNSSMAVTRRRDISAGPNLRSRSNSQASKSAGRSMSTPPATPKRFKKRVRFSDPRPETRLQSTSSGLTPFISRTTLQTTPPSSGHCAAPATLSNRGDYDVSTSRTLQFEPLRQVLDSRLKRRLRRHRLSEEANNIEREDKREVKFLRAEVERLKTELEAKCVEMQIIKDKEALRNQEKPGDSLTTSMERNTRIQELEQQVTDLKAKLQQKEAESESFEHADSVMVSRDLLSPNDDNGQVITTDDAWEGMINDDNDDNGQVITTDDAWEGMINDDMIRTPTRFNISCLSPPPTMPNTPSRSSRSQTARVRASIPNPDFANGVLNNKFQLKLDLKGIKLVNRELQISQPSIVRSRKGKADWEGYAVGTRERRYAIKLTTMLVPDF